MSKRGWQEIPIAGIPFLESTEYHTGDWKVFRPVIDEQKCVKCGNVEKRKIASDYYRRMK